MIKRMRMSHLKRKKINALLSTNWLPLHLILLKRAMTWAVIMNQMTMKTQMTKIQIYLVFRFRDVRFWRRRSILLTKWEQKEQGLNDYLLLDLLLQILSLWMKKNDLGFIRMCFLPSCIIQMLSSHLWQTSYRSLLKLRSRPSIFVNSILLIWNGVSLELMCIPLIATRSVLFIMQVLFSWINDLLLTALVFLLSSESLRVEIHILKVSGMVWDLESALSTKDIVWSQNVWSIWTPWAI